MVETRRSGRAQPLFMTTELPSSTLRQVTPSPSKRTSPKTPSSSTPKKAKASPKPGSPATPPVLRSNQLSKVTPDEDYQDLQVPPCELRPSTTLTTGQCFHWRVVEPDDAVLEEDRSAWGSHNATEWVGILRIPGGQSIVVSLKETPETTLSRVLYAPPDINVKTVLFQYFGLDEPLEPLYREWSKADPRRLARIAECIPGVRIIQQDPWECLVSFICSSNNNIPRITKMLSVIRQQYGKPLVTIGEQTLYSFPSLDEFRNQATDASLRTIGLGYRSKYLMETMETLYALGGEAYLAELRDEKDPVLVQEKLTQFSGVGPKVADCVALFSLGQGDAIPVDVHVWDIARRDYDVSQKLAETKSLTPSIYRQVGDLFRTRFPHKAGWAHSLLFVAELPSFREALPKDIVQEMEEFRKVEQAKKAAAREAKRKRKKSAD